MAELWWAALTAADEALLPLLSDEERSRATSLQREADQARSLLGAALLRTAAGQALGSTPRDIVVDRTCEECGEPHGAPRIIHPQDFPSWVSVSHSGVLVVVAISLAGPVGIDVERIPDGSDIPTLREWVRKEAQFKTHAAPAVSVVHDLACPLEHYVGAVALASGEGYRVRYWSPD